MTDVVMEGHDTIEGGVYSGDAALAAPAFGGGAVPLPAGLGMAAISVSLR